MSIIVGDIVTGVRDGDRKQIKIIKQENQLSVRDNGDPRQPGLEIAGALLYFCWPEPWGYYNELYGYAASSLFFS